MKSALIGTGIESVRSLRSDNTELSDTLCAVLGRAILITELFRSGGETYARKIIEMLYCGTLNIEKFEKLKSGITCSELMHGKASQMPDKKDF